MNKLFELEISRPGSFGAVTSSRLTLPATPYEILDAMDRARVTDDRVIYSAEILSCELDYLPQLLSPNTNLYELNHLAQRLTAISEWELDGFEGMVMMDAVKTGYSPIMIERLINMTHSTADCQVVYEAHDVSTLGLFYADNGFVTQLEALPENVFKWLDYGKIGKEMRESEGGVFTPRGYVVQNGEIAEAYKSGDAVPRQKPDYSVLLKVIKGYFNDAEYDTNSAVYLKLPASDMDVSRAIAEIGAASVEECVFTAEDSAVPRFTGFITDTLENTVGPALDFIRELAAQLRNLTATGSLPTYMAMLEAAPKDISLDEALDLAYQTDSFRLLRESASPEDYARAELAKRDIPFKDELFSCANLWRYGEKLMEQNQSAVTEYGILIARDGQMLEQCLNRSEHHMKLE